MGTPAAISASVHVVGGYFVGPNFNLSYAYLVSRDFDGYNLSNSNLNGAAVSGTSFRGTDFTSTGLSTDLTGDDLTNANFTNTKLPGAKLTGTTLAGTNFPGAVLTGVASGGITGVPLSIPAGWSLQQGYSSAPAWGSRTSISPGSTSTAST